MRITQIRDSHATVIKSRRVSPEELGASRARRHRKTFAVRREQRKEDTATQRQSLITRWTKPTDEKARESGQIACNRNDALSRFPRLFRSFPFSLLFSAPLSFVTSLLLFLQSLTYRFLWREDQRPAMRETNDPRFFLPPPFFCFYLFLFSSEIVSVARQRANSTE